MFCKSILKIIFTAILFAAVPAFGQDDSIAPVPPDKAHAQMVRHMDGLRTALAEKQVARAKEQAGLVLESKWDGALENLPVYSLALIEWADKVSELLPSDRVTITLKSFFAEGYEHRRRITIQGGIPPLEE